MSRLRRRGGGEEGGGRSPSPRGADTSAPLKPSLAAGPLAAALVFFLAAAALIAARDASLPAPLSASEAGEGAFSEGRAAEHLRALTSLGPRLVGSRANEVGAVEYLLGALREANRTATTPGFRVEVEVQRPSGTLSLDFLFGFTSAYQNVTNILARVTSDATEGGEDARSLLVSAHFDSQIGTAGASDDAVNVGNALEILRALAHQPAGGLRHAVVFNLNGAEETILQASHGFITQHRWAAGVGAFVNLEAAGSGGRELVFQTGPGHAWLARAYASSAPRPYASTVAQEIFQSGVIPSDTDFRVYSDYGGVPGLDVAYVARGYLYHTTLDTADRVEPGASQHLGDNMLALVRHLADSDELADPAPHARELAVYYDVLGLFAVVYGSGTAAALNGAAVAASCAYLASSGGLAPLAGATLALVLGALAALAAPALVGGAMYVTGAGCMSWYARPWLVPGLFMAPAALALLAVQRVRGARGRRRSPAALEHESFRAGLLLWTAALAALAASGLGSAYVALHWVVWPLAARALAWPRGGAATPARVAAYLGGGLAAPTLVCGQLLWTLLEFFVPVQGRVGTHVPADAVVGVLAGVVVAVVLLLASSLVHVERAWPRVRAALAAVFVVSAALAVASDPYSAARPKRLFAQHVRRSFWRDGSADAARAADAAVYLVPIDPLGVAPLEGRRFLDALPAGGARPGLVEAVRSAPLFYCDHARGVYCDFPWLMSLKDVIDGVRPVPADPDAAPSRRVLELVSDEVVAAAGRRRRRTFVARGPDHMSLYVRRCERSAALADWSLATEHGGPMISSVARDSYFVYFASGNPGGRELSDEREWRFWIDTEQDDERPLRMAVATHDFESAPTPEVAEVMAIMPDWVDVIGWYSDWEGHEFR